MIFIYDLLMIFRNTYDIIFAKFDIGVIWMNISFKFIASFPNEKFVYYEIWRIKTFISTFFISKKSNKNRIGFVLRARYCGALLYLFTYMMLHLHNPFSTIDIFNDSVNDIYSQWKLKSMRDYTTITICCSMRLL